MKNADKQIQDLFTAQSHLGHKTNRIHPKARKFIYTIENGVSIIDLTQTADLLEKAKAFIAQLGKENKKVLFVGTKKIASNFIEEIAKTNGLAYITLKWPAGLLTNFDTIFKNVKKLKTMMEESEKGEWQKLVKHEQSSLKKELSKLQRHYGGLINFEKIPDALFIIDVKKEKNAVTESRMMKIPMIAIADTNVDPYLVDYPIPANDDSLSSVEYIVKDIVSAYTKGKGK